MYIYEHNILYFNINIDRLPNIILILLLYVHIFPVFSIIIIIIIVTFITALMVLIIHIVLIHIFFNLLLLSVTPANWHSNTSWRFIWHTYILTSYLTYVLIFYLIVLCPFIWHIFRHIWHIFDQFLTYIWKADHKLDSKTKVTRQASLESPLPSCSPNFHPLEVQAQFLLLVIFILENKDKHLYIYMICMIYVWNCLNSSSSMNLNRCDKFKFSSKYCLIKID